MSTARTYSVPAPDSRMVGVLVALVLGGYAVAFGLLLRHPEAQRSLGWLLASLVVVIALTLGIVLRRSVRLEDGRLKIAAGLNSTQVAVSQLDMEHARIVRLDDHPEFRPGIKTFGSQMPGYQAGHFRQAGGTRVFALLTERERVLVLPERSGRLLLLSLEQPQTLLEALRREHARP